MEGKKTEAKREEGGGLGYGRVTSPIHSVRVWSPANSVHRTDTPGQQGVTADTAHLLPNPSHSCAEVGAHC